MKNHNEQHIHLIFKVIKSLGIVFFFLNEALIQDTYLLSKAECTSFSSNTAKPHPGQCSVRYTSKQKFPLHYLFYLKKSFNHNFKDFLRKKI